MARPLLTTWIVLLVLLLSACGTPTPSPTPPPTDTPTPEAPTATPESGEADLLAVAAADGRFTTLLAAIADADLEEKLSTAGPYTFFAPTDDAFTGLPSDALADPDRLFDILLYHVAEGLHPAATLADTPTLTTLLGDDLTVSISGDMVMVNDATVTQADIQAGNGIIHVIDAVLVPPAE